MTDTTSVSSQIDAMIAARPASTGPAQNHTPDLRIETESGTITQLAPATHPGISDTDGYVLGSGVADINAQIERLTTQTNEVRFDKATGAQTFVRTDREREQDAARLVTLRASRTYQVERDEQLRAAREEAINAKTIAQREAAARFAYTQGSPDKAALLDKAIAEEEAKAAAAAIVAGRRG